MNNWDKNAFALINGKFVCRASVAGVTDRVTGVLRGASVLG